MKKIVFNILITLGIGSLPALFINFKNYNNFIKPPLSPPGYIFPIVWTILFILMAISISRINDKNIIKLYFISLIVNALWTPIFFGLNIYLFSFIWLILLLILVLILTFKIYKIDKKSVYLLVPYILWLFFAGYLNLGVYLLN